MGLDGRLQQMRDFFASGKSVCPYAKSYVERIKLSLVPEGFGVPAVKGPILDFVDHSSWMALVYVFEREEKTHVLERQRVIGLFKTLLGILVEEERGEKLSREARSNLERQLDWAFSPLSDRNPLLGYQGKPLFSIAMNPLYTESHPRWAPCASLVVTRQEDVAAIPGQAVDSIRTDILKRVGRLYDADELYLDPNKVAVTI